MRSWPVPWAAAALLVVAVGALAADHRFGDRHGATTAPSAAKASSPPAHGAGLAGATTRPKPSPQPLTAQERAILATVVTDAVHSVVAGTEIGLAVYDRRTDSVVTSKNANRQFYSASVVKLLMAIDVLRASGWVPYDGDRERLTALLASSNDAIASALWAARGGVEILHRTVPVVGLAHTDPPGQVDDWELTRLSANDVVRIYEFIDRQVPLPARSLIMDALADATNPAADGFDQFFGIPAALPDREWAIKQGWMYAKRGLVLNTTGVVGDTSRYVVALLTEQPGSTPVDRGRDAVTAGVRPLSPAIDGDDADP